MGFAGVSHIETGAWSAIADAGRGGYSDPGLHGGVRGRRCRRDSNFRPLGSIVEGMSVAMRVQATEAVESIEEANRRDEK